MTKTTSSLFATAAPQVVRARRGAPVLLLAPGGPGGPQLSLVPASPPEAFDDEPCAAPASTLPASLRIAPADAAAARPEPVCKTVALETEIVAALEAAPAYGQPAADAFRAKEQAVGALFARLDVNDARELHRRLTTPVDTDALAHRFGRLVPERRIRLLAFLGDARRRAALASARGR